MEPTLLLEEEDSTKDADQVREIGDITRITEVLISGSQHRAFNDDSSNNNNDGNNDNIRPTSPLTDNSLYSKSIYRLDSEAGLIQLSNNIDQAAYSNIDNASNSNNRPKDQ